MTQLIVAFPNLAKASKNVSPDKNLTPRNKYINIPHTLLAQKNIFSWCYPKF
jgi:hypothetical protein